MLIRLTSPYAVIGFDLANPYSTETR